MRPTTASSPNSEKMDQQPEADQDAVGPGDGHERPGHAVLHAAMAMPPPCVRGATYTTGA